MIPIALFQSLWMFFLWLVFTSNLISQTTWLKPSMKVKLKLLPAGGLPEILAILLLVYRWLYRLQRVHQPCQLTGLQQQQGWECKQ